MGAADHDLGAFFGDGDVDDVNLDALALAQHLAGHLLVVGQDGLVFAQIDDDDAAHGIDLEHDGGDDLVRLALHLGVHLAALGLAQGLADDVLGRLGGDAAELLGLERNLDLGADAGRLFDVLRLLQRHLGARVLDLVDDVLDDGHRELAGLRLDDDADVLLDVVALFDRDDDGCLDLLDQIALADAALLLQQSKRLKKFAVHFLCFLPQPAALRACYQSLKRSSSSHSLARIISIMKDLNRKPSRSCFMRRAQNFTRRTTCAK